MEGMDGVYHAMASLQLCAKCSIRTCPKVACPAGLVRSFLASSPHFETYKIPMEAMDGVEHAMASLQLCTKCSIRTCPKVKWHPGPVRSFSASSPHFVTYRIPVEAMDGVDHAMASLQLCAKYSIRTCPKVEWPAGLVRSFLASSPHFETYRIPMEAMDGVEHAMASLQLCAKCSIRTCPKGEWHPGLVRSFLASSPHFVTYRIPVEAMDGVDHAMASLQLCTK
ncbi:hypothetical protein M9434_004900 [Picochlorum sp. BPE23]|nr:hypothetical protein M9434_004900 [Picochlorum sp. BPE23]